MMQLADAIIASQRTTPDKFYAGAIGSMPQVILRSQRFELADEVAEACRQVVHSRPSSLLSALAMMRLPYPAIWAEWRAHPEAPTADENCPGQVGCLYEAMRTGELRTGMLRWAWVHPAPRDQVVIGPIGVFFDWALDADIPATFQQMGRQLAALPSLVEQPHWDGLVRGWYDDVTGEFPFAEAFIALLNSRQGLERTREDLTRLNRKRQKSGKRPLCEFVTTRLDLSRGQAARHMASGMSREAARRHLVRGHFKVRKSGIYWWTPFMRGHGEAVPRSITPFTEAHDGAQIRLRPRRAAAAICGTADMATSATSTWTPQAGVALLRPDLADTPDRYRRAPRRPAGEGEAFAVSKVIRINFRSGEDQSAAWSEEATKCVAVDEPITAFYRVLKCVVAALKTLDSPAQAPLVDYSAALLVAAFRILISSVADVFHRLEEDNGALQQRAYEHLADDFSGHFIALCAALDAHAPIGQLAFHVQIEFERFAERLGLPRPWNTATTRNPRPPRNQKEEATP
jgi:hypothetical protein